jgi:hypothetical protein
LSLLKMHLKLVVSLVTFLYGLIIHRFPNSTNFLVLVNTWLTKFYHHSREKYKMHDTARVGWNFHMVERCYIMCYEGLSINHFENKYYYCNQAQVISISIGNTTVGKKCPMPDLWPQAPEGWSPVPLTGQQLNLCMCISWPLSHLFYKL